MMHVNPVSGGVRLAAHVFPDADAASRAAAGLIADTARHALQRQDHFLLALSGGRTPGRMFNHLAAQELPWRRVHLFQADERVAPAGAGERSYTNLQLNLLMQARRPEPEVHPMPVEMADLAAAARTYGALLAQLGGRPPVLDLVHLGLGADGHAASLVPDDSVLEVQDRDVAITGLYQGRCRMTLTFPLINRAKSVLWLVTGSEKAEMLARLCAGDASVPAGRIQRRQAVIFADEAAAALI
jgi:6-phosphogluconolactonase